MPDLGIYSLAVISVYLFIDYFCVPGQEVDELRRSGTALAERVATLQRLQEEVDRLNKKLNSEIMLKQQAVNKLAEIMNR